MDCSQCGNLFSEYRTANEKLLQAIFLGPLCPTCRDLVEWCNSCGKHVDKPIYFNRKPHHLRCLPNSK